MTSHEALAWHREALYSNGQFVTCSGRMLNPLSSTVTGGNAWFQPTTVYGSALRRL